jgi:hypothetical protein
MRIKRKTEKPADRSLLVECIQCCKPGQCIDLITNKRRQVFMMTANGRTFICMDNFLVIPDLMVWIGNEDVYDVTLYISPELVLG